LGLVVVCRYGPSSVNAPLAEEGLAEVWKSVFAHRCGRSGVSDPSLSEPIAIKGGTYNPTIVGTAALCQEGAYKLGGRICQFIL
jgi:hypothetical protein